MNDEDWADPDTLLGMLERGRGRGLRLALSEPGADAQVARCIQRDVKWELQTEQRGEYFASLVAVLGLPLGELAVDLTDPELPYTVWFETALALARRGSDSAVQLLHAYLRDAAPARSVEVAVELIWDEAGPAGRVGLRELALRRLAGDALRNAVDPRPDGPWWCWRDEPAVAVALASRVPAPWAPAPDLSAVDRAGLLAVACQPRHSSERRGAFSELSRRGEPTLLDLAERPELRNPFGVVAGLRSPLIDLGPVALPRARSWATSDDDFLRSLSGDLLAAHGGASDGQVLLEMFEADAHRGYWDATEPLATGLGRVGHAAAIPALTRAWACTRHSHARASYLSALVDLRADQVGGLLAEAVDDCESEVRRLAPTPLLQAGIVNNARHG